MKLNKVLEEHHHTAPGYIVDHCSYCKLLELDIILKEANEVLKECRKYVRGDNFDVKIIDKLDFIISKVEEC